MIDERCHPTRITKFFFVFINQLTNYPTQPKPTPPQHENKPTTKTTKIMATDMKSIPTIQSATIVEQHARILYRWESALTTIFDKRANTSVGGLASLVHQAITKKDKTYDTSHVSNVWGVALSMLLRTNELYATTTTTQQSKTIETNNIDATREDLDDAIRIIECLLRVYAVNKKQWLIKGSKDESMLLVGGTGNTDSGGGGSGNGSGNSSGNSDSGDTILGKGKHGKQKDESLNTPVLFMWRTFQDLKTALTHIQHDQDMPRHSDTKDSKLPVKERKTHLLATVYYLSHAKSIGSCLTNLQSAISFVSTSTVISLADDYEEWMSSPLLLAILAHGSSSSSSLSSSSSSSSSSYLFTCLWFKNYIFLL